MGYSQMINNERKVSVDYSDPYSYFVIIKLINIMISVYNMTNALWHGLSFNTYTYNILVARGNNNK